MQKVIPKMIKKLKKPKKTKKTRKEKIIMALKSWKFWRYNLISLTSNPVSDMIFSLCRRNLSNRSKCYTIIRYIIFYI